MSPAFGYDKIIVFVASIKSYVFFFLAEGLANGFLKDEMILQGSDSTNASVYAAGLGINNTF